MVPFRIKVDLSNFFNDFRSTIYVLVVPNFKFVKDLEKHIEDQFNIRVQFVVNEEVLLPSKEPISIIKEEDRLKAIKKRKLKYQLDKKIGLETIEGAETEDSGSRPQQILQAELNESMIVNDQKIDSLVTQLNAANQATDTKKRIRKRKRGKDEKPSSVSIEKEENIGEPRCPHVEFKCALETNDCLTPREIAAEQSPERSESDYHNKKQKIEIQENVLLVPISADQFKIDGND